MSPAPGYVVLRASARPSAEIEIKRSRFLGFAARTETEQQARDFLAEIRRQHREARHICHGFVLGPDRASQRSSDDGEPAGTAGMPILKSILARQTHAGRAELSDVTVAVVRYFGGIKLGAGGLVQAYADASARVLDEAELVLRRRMRLLDLAVPIEQAGRFETSLRASGIVLLSVDYRADQVQLQIAVPDDPNELAAASAQLAASSGGQVSPVPGEFCWIDTTDSSSDRHVR